MNSTLFLKNEDYSFYNAMVWGNFKAHYHRASEGPGCRRIIDVAIACLELLPVVSQIVSLAEFAIFKAWPPHSPTQIPAIPARTSSQPAEVAAQIQEPLDFSTLTKKPIRLIIPSQEIFPHRQRSLAPKTEERSLQISLPEQMDDLEKTLFVLHRQIDMQYLHVPWPTELQNIVVLTSIEGGRGDIVAAAKVIGLMQEMCPRLNFDWILSHFRDNPQSFLTCRNPSKVSLRKWGSQPQDETPGDLLVLGPTRSIYEGKKGTRKYTQREVRGPLFHFLENGAKSNSSHRGLHNILDKILDDSREEPSLDIYRKILHPYLFKTDTEPDQGLHTGIPMGLQKGSGILLNEESLDIPPLSRGYCCPSYLLQIEDEALKNDILQSMGVFDGHSVPDYDQHSFNCGYAHSKASWERFIDFTAIQEREKHLTFVLNQTGASNQLTTQQFAEQIFTPGRLAYLKRFGYGTIIVKGPEKGAFVMQENFDPEKRRLVVIVRPYFQPLNMKRLQLAAERILATGDNSAVEAWTARCKGYFYEVYECVNSCKRGFLEQQVALAREISPALGQLLELFGTTPKTPLTEEQMEQAEQLLQNPQLPDDTLQYCDRITSSYSARDVFVSALKRSAWLSLHPELNDIEADAIDEEFRIKVVDYFKELTPEQFLFQKQPPPRTPQIITIRNLSQLAERINKVCVNESED